MAGNRFIEMSKVPQSVTTYAAITAALGGETSDKMRTAAFYDMESYDAVLGICIASNVVLGSVVTFNMYQATTSAGAGWSTISGASTTYTSAHSTDVGVFVIEVDAKDLTDGYDFVGIEASTNKANGSEAVSVAIVPTYGRIEQETTLS